MWRQEILDQKPDRRDLAGATRTRPTAGGLAPGPAPLRPPRPRPPAPLPPPPRGRLYFPRPPRDAPPFSEIT